jgi:hypothetical protein
MNGAGLPWKDIIGGALGLYEAYDKSKNALDPRDIYRMMNPSSSTPFFNVNNDWNRGNPMSTVTMSDQLKPLADNMFASVGSPVEKRTMSNGMKELQNANMNWQRARYGLDPIAFEPSANNPPPVDSPTDVPSMVQPGTGSPGMDYPTDEIDPMAPSGGRGVGQGSNQDAANRIVEGLIGGGAGGNSDYRSMEFRDINQNGTDDRDEGLGWQGESGETGWNWFDESGYNPATWRDDWNASELENALGQNDIGSLGGMEAPEAIGSVASALSGIPGLGYIANKMTNGGYNPDKNYFSPVNKDDPYGVRKDPTGMFPPPEELPHSPATGGRSGGSVSNPGGINPGGSSAGRPWGWGLRASRIG